MLAALQPSSEARNCEERTFISRAGIGASFEADLISNHIELVHVVFINSADASVRHHFVQILGWWFAYVCRQML